MNFRSHAAHGNPAPSRQSSPANDGVMFGCECALPFLTALHTGAQRGALSGLAFGAVLALGACDVAPPPPLQAAPVDKVSAAFDELEGEIARTKARLDWSRPRRVADGDSPRQP